MTPLQPDESHLIWIDLEMTGLDPSTDSILEIATIVTDRDLNLIAEGPDGVKILAYGEGTAATCVAAGAPGDLGSLSLLVDGQGMTKLVTETKLITHLPYLLAKDPKRYMIVCFGMGTTTRSAQPTQCRWP